MNRRQFVPLFLGLGLPPHRARVLAGPSRPQFELDRIHAKDLRGTWESDRERTLGELQSTLGPKHARTLEYAQDPSKLILHYTKTTVTYYFRDMVCDAKHAIVSEDEHTLLTKVEPSDLTEQSLWHLHFLDASTYWVSVDQDKNLVYREFFKKLDDSVGHEERVERAFASWQP